MKFSKLLQKLIFE